FINSSTDITAVAIIIATEVEAAIIIATEVEAAIIIATEVEAVLTDIVEVMALIEAGTIAIKMKEIPLLVINRIYDGIGILHIPKDRIADSGIEKVGIATHTTTTI